MKTSYAAAWRASGTLADDGGSVSVLVNRTVSTMNEKPFLETLEKLLAAFDAFPGTLGSKVFRRTAGRDVEYSIVQRFARESDHENWLASPEFAEWQRRMAPPEPAPDHVRRYVGLEALFVSAAAPDAPPKWKMAIILMIAVLPMSMAMSHWGAPVLARVSVFWGSLATSVLMVVTMTYALVPLLTAVFQKWLRPVRRA
ncbi:MAG TPA: antibiotic biosynthesis monooxygenase [Terrimicrobiaceae bacterium]|nr:antibiotic biosynthesis monooxygenase [Terrimicrobiaceae bacterium]